MRQKPKRLKDLEEPRATSDRTGQTEDNKDRTCKSAHVPSSNLCKQCCRQPHDAVSHAGNKRRKRSCSKRVRQRAAPTHTPTLVSLTYVPLALTAAQIAVDSACRPALQIATHAWMFLAGAAAHAISSDLCCCLGAGTAAGAPGPAVTRPPQGGARAAMQAPGPRWPRRRPPRRQPWRAAQT